MKINEHFVNETNNDFLYFGWFFDNYFDTTELNKILRENNIKIRMSPIYGMDIILLQMTGKSIDEIINFYLNLKGKDYEEVEKAVQIEVQQYFNIKEIDEFEDFSKTLYNTTHATKIMLSYILEKEPDFNYFTLSQNLKPLVKGFDDKFKHMVLFSIHIFLKFNELINNHQNQPH